MEAPTIHLHVEPGIVESWSDFQENKPPFSIALDGRVNSISHYTSLGPYANFDHHTGVNRLATRSTVGQVLMAINLGLFETFSRDGEAFANVFVNDCDQDVCLSYWLLKNSHRIREFHLEMDIARLIIGEDLLDASAGAYPINHEHPIVKKMAWIFEEYDQLRSLNQLCSMNGDEMKCLIENTCERLDLLDRGEAHEIELVGDYQIIGGGTSWKLVREYGTYARSKLFADGIRAFIAVRDRSDGNYDYTVGRMSPFVQFPLDKIYSDLNSEEELPGIENCWGGSDTIGGSPRQSGSRLKPEKVEAIVDRIVLQNWVG